VRKASRSRTRELESRELLDADPANPLGDAFLEAPRGTESSQTHRWRGVDSNFRFREREV
jgi:hypothetical protein